MIRPLRNGVFRGGLAVIAFTGALVLLPGGPTPAQPASAAPTPAVSMATLAGRPSVGAVGCTATACHGGPASSLTAPIDATGWQGSATHWQARDPHTRAYDALTGPAACKIMSRLRVPKPGGGFLAATEYDRCLACHTDPQLVGRAAPEQLAAGIGCEACHGSAGDWLRPHTTWRTPEKRIAGYAATGMAPLYDLGERAAVCTGCHVGAPVEPGKPAGGAVRRDMNHDMIAAGHPRLDGFDFAEAQRRLTPHWFERDRTKPGQPPRGPDAEWRAWLVGRVACGEASARLLADRAAHSPTWPELAESNCAGCHHATPDAARRAAADATGEFLGNARWQTVWPLTGGGLPEASGLADLARWVSRTRAPDPAEAVKRATGAAEQLSAWRSRLATAPDDLRPLAGVWLPPTAASLRDPADAAELLCGLAALARAGRPSESLPAALARFRVTPADANATLDAALTEARR